MRKTLLNLLSVVVITSSATIASAAKLGGTKGTLQNIDTAIYATIRYAENLFEENSGDLLNRHYNMVKNDKNPYIKTLKIDKDYRILFQFDGTAKKGKKLHRAGRNYVTPVAKALLNKQIVLIPVYNKDDEKITSWECVTNADKDVQGMMGSTGTKEFTASFIRGETDNKYLSICTFINQNRLF